MLKLAKKRSIIQKFLEPGHTHMEVDTMHKKIETSMKNRDINHPNDYIDMIRKPEKILLNTMSKC